MESHLLQMRGLKPKSRYPRLKQKVSHLLQMRGLKLLWQRLQLWNLVASFTDAWIET